MYVHTYHTCNVVVHDVVLLLCCCAEYSYQYIAAIYELCCCCVADVLNVFWLFIESTRHKKSHFLSYNSKKKKDRSCFGHFLPFYFLFTTSTHFFLPAAFYYVVPGTHYTVLLAAAFSTTTSTSIPYTTIHHPPLGLRMPYVLSYFFDTGGTRRQERAMDSSSLYLEEEYGPADKKSNA